MKGVSNKPNDKNQEALEAYCKVLLKLFELQDPDFRGPRPWKKSKLSPSASVINRMISAAIRGATDSAHPFGYSDSGKTSAQYISEKAEPLWNSGEHSGLKNEHIIPVSVLENHIRENWEKWNVENLAACFIKYSIRAIVTSDEENRLRRSDMPYGKTIDDKFSRYCEAKIKLKNRSHGPAKQA